MIIRAMIIPIIGFRGIITMTDAGHSVALLRLMTWLSPSFPVGAFSYSHGLEWAVESGAINDRIQLTDWISKLLETGGGWSDAVLFGHAFDVAESGDVDRLIELAALAEALAPSRERHLETMAQGTAFLKASAAWPDDVRAGVKRAIRTATLALNIWSPPPVQISGLRPMFPPVFFFLGKYLDFLGRGLSGCSTEAEIAE